MAITFTPWLKKKYATDKHGIINIRITNERKSTYISLKEKLHERFWNEKAHEIRSHKDFNPKERERLNELIENKIKELKKLYKVSGNVEKTKANSNLSFIDFLNAELVQLERRGKIGTFKRYKTLYYHLIGYLATKNANDLLFSEITTQLVRDFETYILSLKTIKGTNIKNNTSKNYINCFKRLYNQALKLNAYTTSFDPFILFINKRLPVEKKRLTKMQVELIYTRKIDKSNELYNIRNYFLFQIFCQGLRVSDLITLRFKNINRPESRFDFYQFKTKKPHSILINDNLILILIDYIKTDLSPILEKKYAVELKNGKVENLNFEEIKNRYDELARQSIRAALKTEDEKGMAATKDIFEEQERMKKVFNDYMYKMTVLLYNGIVTYARKHPNDFIFPILKNEDFIDVEFTENTILTKYQYNQMQSKTAMYNEKLKDLQEFIGLSMPLTSHLSRHTYTNLMFAMDPKLIYEISKGLGHSSINITENYLNSFDKKTVDEPNVRLTEQFTFLKTNENQPQ